jgi:DNA (cytosine-5)-methyltransferase 1
MSRPQLLDLFCGAGGASMGYHQAGFDVLGVDIKPQPNYPFDFLQADALQYLASVGDRYDAIHASPPCQAYSQTKAMNKNNPNRRHHPDLVAPTRELLQRAGRPWVMENVVGAPLAGNVIRLRGNSFGLKVKRDRLFESSVLLLSPQLIPMIGHSGLRDGRTRAPSMQRGDCDYLCVVGRNFLIAEARDAMGIPWMTSREIVLAIPPAYTEWIGRQLVNYCEVPHADAT